MRAFLLFLSLGLGTVSGAGAAGPWRARPDNTPGWAWMTPRERVAHQATVRAFTDYDACRVYQAQHHQTLQARAQASGQVLHEPARDFCDRLRPSNGAR